MHSTTWACESEITNYWVQLESLDPMSRLTKNLQKNKNKQTKFCIQKINNNKKNISYPKRTTEKLFQQVQSLNPKNNSHSFRHTPKRRSSGSFKTSGAVGDSAAVWSVWAPQQGSGIGPWRMKWIRSEERWSDFFLKFIRQLRRHLTIKITFVCQFVCVRMTNEQ